MTGFGQQRALYHCSMVGSGHSNSVPALFERDSHGVGKSIREEVARETERERERERGLSGSEVREEVCVCVCVCVEYGERERG